MVIIAHEYRYLFQGVASMVDIVAPADDDLPKRLHIVTEPGAPAMIFVSYEYLFPHSLKIAFHRHVGHEARAATFGIEIEQAHAFKLRPLRRFVIVAEQLEARAYAEEDHVGLRRFDQGWPFELDIA